MVSSHCLLPTPLCEWACAFPWLPAYSPSLWAARKDLALLIKLPTALCFWHQLCCQGPCLAPAVPLVLPQQCVAHREGWGELSPQHPVSVPGLCCKLLSTLQTVCWEHRAFTAWANQMSKVCFVLWDRRSLVNWPQVLSQNRCQSVRGLATGEATFCRSAVLLSKGLGGLEPGA